MDAILPARVKIWPSMCTTYTDNSRLPGHTRGEVPSLRSYGRIHLFSLELETAKLWYSIQSEWVMIISVSYFFIKPSHFSFGQENKRRGSWLNYLRQLGRFNWTREEISSSSVQDHAPVWFWSLKVVRSPFRIRKSAYVLRVRTMAIEMSHRTPDFLRRYPWFRWARWLWRTSHYRNKRTFPAAGKGMHCHLYASWNLVMFLLSPTLYLTESHFTGNVKSKPVQTPYCGVQMRKCKFRTSFVSRKNLIFLHLLQRVCRTLPRF